MYAWVRPPPSKADPDGSKWGASPICSQWSATEPINFAREFVEYELMRNLWSPAERDLAPLLMNEAGECWRKDALAEFFHQLLLQVVSAEDAKNYSCHSFRIFLACALRDAGVPNDAIREALRWSTDEALLLYARANLSYDAALRARAASADVSSVRVPTVLSVDQQAQEEARRLGTAMDSPLPEPVAVGFPSPAALSQSLRAVSLAAAARGAINKGTLPDVDSDLRALSEVATSMNELRREAERPIDTAAVVGRDGAPST